MLSWYKSTNTDAQGAAPHAAYLGRNLPVERLEKEFKECEAKELRFAIGTRVLANVGTWKAGTVIRHWDDGNAYRVDVDGVGNVWARFDDDDLIRPVEDA